MVFEANIRDITDHTMWEGMKKEPENGFFSCVPFFGGHFDLLKDVEPEMSSCKVPTYNRIIFPLGTPFSLDWISEVCINFMFHWYASTYFFFSQTNPCRPGTQPGKNFKLAPFPAALSVLYL